MKEYLISELKESSLIMGRRTPAFGWIITLIVLILIISVLLLAGFSPKTYIVKASGLTTSDDKVNIMNIVGGPIKKINVSEGQKVNRGDILIELDSGQVNLQIIQLDILMDVLQSKMGKI